jgi:DNA-binding CsgD family transcriptional regulator
MTFKPGDFKKLYYSEIRHGRNRRRYQKHEGRKRAYFVFWNPDGDVQSIVKYSTKDVKPEVIDLRGPDDLKKSKHFQEILAGKKLDYPYLTKTENRMLTMRSLGKTRAKIARALSGGIKRRSYTAASIKYILETIRKKIRSHENERFIHMKKICTNLSINIVREIDRFADETGKTRTRCIHEACLEYLIEHATSDPWFVKHFEVDSTKWLKIQKCLVDLENDGVVALEDDGTRIYE